jgi:hypothetical protein
MHMAYRVSQLLKLPLAIESLKAIGDHLLVGTKQGHLLMYSVTFNSLSYSPDDTNDNYIHAQLLRSNKTFSKKAILQLDAVQELSILVALSDSAVTVHDIDLSTTNFPVITQMPRTKGASAFALDISRQKSLTGETAITVRLVVAVRRKLQFYFWKNRQFLEFRPDINLPDIPKSIAWCKDTICVGYRSEYGMVKVNCGGTPHAFELCELFPTGKNQEAKITLMSDERFALGKDEQTTFIGRDGQPALEALTWTETPQNMAYDPPFFVATLASSVEIRTETPKLSIQTLDLPKPIIVSTIPNKPGIVYIASTSHIWCLRMVPVSIQIPQLLNDKQFELAMTLTNVSENKVNDKAQRVQKIQTLFAFDLFCNFKFKESMEVFYKLDIDASHVIGLYTELLPPEFSNQLQYPDKLPLLQGRDMENGYSALVEYLTSVRHKLQGSSAKTISPLALTEASMVIKSKKQLLQIIDTTLLKCYLKINDSLVASLLRLKTNFCHLEETERALKKCQKYSELIIFYNTKEFHHKALALLNEQSNILDSPLFGNAKTIQYLQHLGPEHIDLVCEYAGPVLNKSSSEGLSIFTEDLLEVESWPRGNVLDFLMRNCKEVVIEYLEHIINYWTDRSQLFHNALILSYKDHLVNLFEKSEVSSRSTTSSQANDMEEPPLTDQIKSERNKLHKLLLSSKYFTAETVLPQFPLHCLHEERALLLGSLGKHKEALSLYLYQVHDLPEALYYCEKHYTKGSQVYTTLYQLLVAPPEPLALKAMYVSPVNAHASIEPDIKMALKLLEEHYNKIDLKVVLTSTPSSVLLSEITPYLETHLGQRVSKRHQMQLLRGLMHAEHLRVQEERIALESQKVVIEETDVCPVCHKRFRSQSAIVRFPNGHVVHYSCQERAILM